MRVKKKMIVGMNEPLYEGKNIAKCNKFNNRHNVPKIISTPHTMIALKKDMRNYFLDSYGELDYTKISLLALHHFAKRRASCI